MAKRITFDMQKWITDPEAYPMVQNRKITPLKQYDPVLGLFGVRVSDGDVLIERDDGRWFAIPEDVYRNIREVT